MFKFRTWFSIRRAARKASFRAHLIGFPREKAPLTAN